MTQSLAELGQISKAGGPFDLTAYGERRARRAGRRIARRANRGHALGRAGGRAAYDTVMGAGHGARQSVRGLMDDVARGAPAIAERTVDDAGKALVTQGSRLAGRAALFGGLGLAAGLGGGAALADLSHRYIRDRKRTRRPKSRQWQPVGKSDDWTPQELAQFRRAVAEGRVQRGRDQKQAGRSLANWGAAGTAVGLMGSHSLRNNVKYNYQGMKNMQHSVDALVGRKSSRKQVAGRAGVGTLRSMKHLPRHNKISAGLMVGGPVAVGLGVWGQREGARKQREGEQRLSRLAWEQ